VAEGRNVLRSDNPGHHDRGLAYFILRADLVRTRSATASLASSGFETRLTRVTFSPKPLWKQTEQTVA
jgi:hypothetical protein